MTVTAKDEYGKTGTASGSITVSASNGSLTVNAGSNITANAGSTATFAGSVSGGTAPYTYSWNFGDGSTTTAGNSASFVGTDTTTQGTWIGSYGAAGSDIIGSTLSLPSYATVTSSGATLTTWSATTSDVRGLEIPGSTNRIAACLYSNTSFTIEVNLTDGQVHPVSLYALDWDSRNRSEQIQVLDGSSGAVLNTQTISSFAGGEYLTWNVSGDVKIQVTLLGGDNAVGSGLFIGAGSSASGSTLTPSHVYANPGTYTATLSATDAAGHSGNSTTAVTVNDVPPTVTVTDPPPVAGSPVSFTASATDVSPAVQAAGYTYAWTFGDGTTGTGGTSSHTYATAGTYTVTVTAMDEYGKTGTASETITISAPGSTGTLNVSAGSSITSNPLATVTFAGSVSGGTAPYSYSWNYGDGNTTAGTSVTFAGTDTTTQGSWSGVYGAAGYDIVGSSPSLPSYASVTTTGAETCTWAATTTDVRGLQISGASSRIAACWYNGSFTIDVNLTDGQMHAVSLYAMDWDARVGRSKFRSSMVPTARF